MSRYLIVFSATLGLASVVTAQPGTLVPGTPLTAASGVGGFGGGVRPTYGFVGPGMGGRFRHGGVGGGFIRPGYYAPGYPLTGVWGGYGFGGFFPYFGYGYNPYPSTTVVAVPVPVYVPTRPPEPTVELSGEATALLVLEFPAAAEVWVNGIRGEGEPMTEWTLTSPVLKANSEYVFEVKARWTAGGKTFEYERAVAVGTGQRSRSLVISGTEVKE